MKALYAIVFFTIIIFHVANSQEYTFMTRDQIKNRLKDHLHKLTVEIGARSAEAQPLKLQEAALYIQEQIRAAGLKPETQNYQYKESVLSNIFVDKPGKSGKKASWTIVGAHYDSVANTPGADDNASGTAVVLVLAEYLASFPNPSPIRFVFFTAEEPPCFRTEYMGSRRYASFIKEKGDKVHLAVCLDMVGYFQGEQSFPESISKLLVSEKFHSPDFLLVTSGSKYGKVTMEFGEMLNKSQKLPFLPLIIDLPGVHISDHASFWEQGYPALMITDTAFHRNPHYHSPQDTQDTLDYDKMAAFVEALAEAIKQ
ncbi:MAG: M28 family peptidase [Candidatus Brocadiae bacterium]|nr:M28 family peptidase [Candidatus Brocadiia bacterium]